MRFLPFVLICLSPGLMAQPETLPAAFMENILLSAWQDPLYQQMTSDISFLQNARLDLPRFEEVEFRTETHEFDPRRQEYAVRLQLNSGQQMRTREALNRQSIAQELTRREAMLEELLFQRYQLILAIHFLQQWDTLYAAKQMLLADQKTIINRQLESKGQQGIRDLLQWEEEQLDQQEKRNTLLNRRTQLLRQLEQWLLTLPTSLPEFRFPPAKDLQNQVDKWTLPTASLGERLQALKAAGVTLEMAEERAEANNLLNFLQIRYTGDDDPLFSDRLTLGVGVELPFRNANSVKLQYLELEQREAERRLADKKRSLAEEWISLRSSWAEKLAVYQAAQAELYRFETAYSPEQLQIIGVLDPEVLLEAQAGILKRRVQLLDAEQEVYQSYLDLLLLAGRLTEYPYRNWWTGERLPVERD